MKNAPPPARAFVWVHLPRHTGTQPDPSDSDTFPSLAVKADRQGFQVEGVSHRDLFISPSPRYLFLISGREGLTR